MFYVNKVRAVSLSCNKKIHVQMTQSVELSRADVFSPA